MRVRLTPRGPRTLAAIALAGASLLVAAAVGSIFLNTALDAWESVAAPGPAGPADGILLLTGLCGGLLALWLGLGMSLTALSTLPGAVGHLCRALAARVAPAAVRKVVAFVLGTTLTAALVPGTALAGIGHEGRPGVVVTTAPAASARGSVAVAAPDASFRLVSERPLVSNRTHLADSAAGPGMVRTGMVRKGMVRKGTIGNGTVGNGAVRDEEATGQAVMGGTALRDLNDIHEAAPAPTWGLESPRQAGDEVVVLRGDSLWSVAARHLGPGASAADIDAEWRRWFAANREVIGDDADVLLPGQRLRTPASPHRPTGSGAGS